MKTAKIPTADSDVLRDFMAGVHEQYHTPEGLHRYSGPRRQMVEDCIRGTVAAQELVRRGSVPTPCRFCLPDRFVPTAR